MIKMYLTNTKKVFNNLNYVEKFFITFPLFALIGSYAINIFYFCMLGLFVYSLFEKKNLINYKKYFLICFLSFSFILFSYFLSDFKNNLSFTRSFFSFRFFLLIMIFLVFVKNKFFFVLLGQISYILVIFLSLDIIFQFAFGFDFFGFKPLTPNRYSGFFDEELIAGAYLSTFYLFSIIYIFSDYKIYKFLIFFLLVFFSIIISGERLALLKFLFLNFDIFFFIIKYFRKKLFFFLITLFIIVIAFLKVQNFQNRVYESLFFFGNNKIIQIDKSYQKLDNSSLLENPWTSHWIASFKIFKDYPLTGVGLKNFRTVCKNVKYNSKNLLGSSSCTSHPHNLYFEILSELGIMGIFIMIFYLYLFIKKIRSLKIKLSDPPFVMFSCYIFFILIPLLPSGSVFSSYYGGILFFIISSTAAYLKIIKN